MNMNILQGEEQTEYHITIVCAGSSSWGRKEHNEVSGMTRCDVFFPGSSQRIGEDSLTYDLAWLCDVILLGI